MSFLGKNITNTSGLNFEGAVKAIYFHSYIYVNIHIYMHIFTDVKINLYLCINNSGFNFEGATKSIYKHM
jgi:hypothetical protein